MIAKQMVKQMTNVALRVASLAAKLALTLYMGRYLGLSDLGVYGLVFAAVTILSSVLGARLDYAVARELVGANQRDTLRLIRDQVAFLGVNYLLFAVVMLVGYALGVASGKLLLIVFVITVFDSLTGALNTNLVAMGSPLFSTALFFMRAGLWCLLAVALGLVWPIFRSVEVILAFWAAGEVLALLVNLWVWRNYPWHEVMKTPVDWGKLWRGVKLCFPMWVGTIGAMMALSVDRFVVSYYLDMEEVGIITFYSSFAVALLSLVQSGFFAFSYPRLIDHYRQGNSQAFWQETKQTGWQVAVFVLFLACTIGIVIPLLAPLFGKPRLATESLTLWLLLAGIWIRANADTFYYVLYARNQDRPLWLGSALFLIPATLGNLVLVPWLGLPGTGVSSILACLFLLLWRLKYVFAKT